MRQGEFWEALATYQREKQTDRRHSAELARGAALRLFNLQLKKQDRIKDPAEFWRMPWDPTPEGDEVARQLDRLSDTERAAAVNDFLQKINK